MQQWLIALSADFLPRYEHDVDWSHGDSDVFLRSMSCLRLVRPERIRDAFAFEATAAILVAFSNYAITAPLDRHWRTQVSERHLWGLAIAAYTGLQRLHSLSNMQTR